MIYKNDNIIEKNDTINGTIKDLLVFFRYKIASLCMTGDDAREGFTQEVREIADLLDELETEPRPHSDRVTISAHVMGGYTIDRGAE